MEMLTWTYHEARWWNVLYPGGRWTIRVSPISWDWDIGSEKRIKLAISQMKNDRLYRIHPEIRPKQRFFWGWGGDAELTIRFKDPLEAMLFRFTHAIT